MTREQVYATRFFGTALEWRLFFGGLVLGMLLGAVYDVMRALRMSLKHPAWAVFLEDVLFMFISGTAYYTYCTELCRGQIRFFVLAATVIGFSAYLLTVGRIVSRLISEVVKIAKNILLALGKVIKKILGVLCGVTYFQSLRKKFNENPCTEGDS